MTHDDDVDSYLRSAQRHRRNRALGAAGLLAAAGIGAIAMVTQMTDQGHAAAFLSLGGSLLFGAVAVLIAVR